MAYVDTAASLHQLVRTVPEWGCVLTHLSSAWARTRSCHAPSSSSTFGVWTATGTPRCLPSHLSRRHSCGPGTAGITSSGLEIVRWSGCTKVRLQWGTEVAAASPSRNFADSRSWNANTALCQVQIIEKNFNLVYGPALPCFIYAQNTRSVPKYMLFFA
jgi:hypothetical protein